MLEVFISNYIVKELSIMKIVDWKKTMQFYLLGIILKRNTMKSKIVGELVGEIKDMLELP